MDEEMGEGGGMGLCGAWTGWTDMAPCVGDRKDGARWMRGWGRGRGDGAVRRVEGLTWLLALGWRGVEGLDAGGLGQDLNRVTESMVKF